MPQEWVSKKGRKKYVLWGTASVGLALVWLGAVAVSSTKTDELQVDRVLRTEASEIREDELIFLTARSGRWFRVVPNVEVLDGKRWHTLFEEDPLIRWSLVKPSGLISVRVPPKGTRWRVKIKFREVDPEEWKWVATTGFVEEKSPLAQIVEQLRRPERVQYLTPKNL